MQHTAVLAAIADRPIAQPDTVRAIERRREEIAAALAAQRLTTHREEEAMRQRVAYRYD